MEAKGISSTELEKTLLEQEKIDTYLVEELSNLEPIRVEIYLHDPKKNRTVAETLKKAGTISNYNIITEPGMGYYPFIDCKMAPQYILLVLSNNPEVRMIHKYFPRESPHGCQG